MSLLSKIKKKAELQARSWGVQKDFAQQLKSIAHLLTGNFSSSLIGLASFALTARALGPADYGILALCFAFTRAIERLVSFQSWQPLIKFGAHALANNELDDMRQLLKFGLLLDIGAALLAWAIAVALVLFASPLIGIGEDTRMFALIYCSVLPFQITGMPTAALRLYGRFSVLAYGQVFGSILRVLVCGIGVALSWQLFEFTVIWMGMQILTSLTMLAIAFGELRRQGLNRVFSASIRGVTKRFPDLWRFALSANFSLTIRSSANEFDTLLVGYLADPASAGLYHIAKRIGRIAQQAGVQVQAVLYPELSKLWAAEAIVKFRQIVRQTQFLLLGAGLGLLAFIFFTIKPLLYWTAGAEFVGAAPLVTVQTIAVVMTLCGSIMRSALLAMGMENSVLRSVLISTAAFHLTAVSMIPVFGAMGANFAHIVMASIWMGTMMVSYHRRIARSSFA